MQATGAISASGSEREAGERAAHASREHMAARGKGRQVLDQMNPKKERNAKAQEQTKHRWQETMKYDGAPAGVLAPLKNEQGGIIKRKQWHQLATNINIMVFVGANWSCASSTTKKKQSANEA